MSQTRFVALLTSATALCLCACGETERPNINTADPADVGVQEDVQEDIQEDSPEEDVSERDIEEDTPDADPDPPEPTCEDDPEDDDDDGVCNALDTCEGFDDTRDSDEDGIPNGCDTCESDSDEDEDGFADDCDICEGGDDGEDDDLDGVPDGCDCDTEDLCPIQSTCEEAREESVTCACNPGFAGDGCININECDEGIDDCTGERRCLDNDGGFVCECLDGFFGADCAGVCDCNTGACNDGLEGDGACDCPESGTFGPQCAPCTCQSGVCDEGANGNGQCTSCDGGFFGPDCDQSCDQGNCTGLVVCDQDNGDGRACDEGCEDGFHGPDCEDTCEQGNCIGPVTCNQNGGDRTCDEGCEDGFFGLDCDQSCEQGNCTGPVTCEQDGNERRCEGCEDGFHGPDCGESCEQGNCIGPVTCDRDGDARVCEGCEDGFFGDDCGEPCEQGHCIGLVVCDQGTGESRICSEGCGEGFVGLDCTLIDNDGDGVGQPNDLCDDNPRSTGREGCADCQSVPVGAPLSSGLVAQAIEFGLQPAPTVALTLGDDDLSEAIDLGFDFDFFGDTFRQIFIASNGFVTFSPDIGATSYNPQTLPNTAAPNALIAGYWTDLNPTEGGTIAYDTQGTAPNRAFVVMFDAVPHFGNADTTATFQIVLRERDSGIEIHCASCQSDGGGATQGLENAGGTRASVPQGRNSAQFETAEDGTTFIADTGPVRLDAYVGGNNTPFQWRPTPPHILELGDDQTSEAIELGATFTLGDNHYDRLYISSNGFVAFSPSIDSSPNRALSGRLLDPPQVDPEEVDIFIDSGLRLPGTDTSGLQNVFDVDLTDIDGDGDLDALVMGESQGQDRDVALFTNTGNGCMTPVRGLFPAYINAEPADLDGDGHIDVAVRTQSELHVHFGDGKGQFPDTTEIAFEDIGRAVGLGDWNSDGNLDIVVSGSSNTVIFGNNGDRTFTETQTFSANALGDHDAILDFDAVDVDGDDDIDIIATIPASNGSALLVNNGSGQFTPRPIGVTGRSTAVGDIDGDGDVDLYMARYRQPDLILTNDGAGNFTEHQQIGEDGLHVSAEFVDIDNDGDLDVIVGSQRDDLILENDGDGNFAVLQTIRNGNTGPLALGDLDGDGDIDLFSAGGILEDGRGNNRVYFNRTDVGTETVDANNNRIPDCHEDAFISLFRTDLDPSRGGFIRHGLQSTDDGPELTVMFDSVPHYAPTPNLEDRATFQAIVRPATNAVEVHCLRCDSDGGDIVQSLGFQALAERALTDYSLARDAFTLYTDPDGCDAAPEFVDAPDDDTVERDPLTIRFDATDADTPSALLLVYATVDSALFPGITPTAAECLRNQGVPGCAAHPTCEVSVCDIDEACCTDRWDSFCAACARGAGYSRGEDAFDCAPVADACTGDLLAVPDDEGYRIDLPAPQGTTGTISLHAVDLNTTTTHPFELTVVDGCTIADLGAEAPNISLDCTGIGTDRTCAARCTDGFDWNGNGQTPAPVFACGDDLQWDNAIPTGDECIHAPTLTITPNPVNIIEDTTGKATYEVQDPFTLEGVQIRLDPINPIVLSEGSDPILDPSDIIIDEICASEARTLDITSIDVLDCDDGLFFFTECELAIEHRGKEIFYGEDLDRGSRITRVDPITVCDPAFLRFYEDDPIGDDEIGVFSVPRLGGMLCEGNGDCASGVCTNGACVGDGGSLTTRLVDPGSNDMTLDINYRVLRENRLVRNITFRPNANTSGEATVRFIVDDGAHQQTAEVVVRVEEDCENADLETAGTRIVSGRDTRGAGRRAQIDCTGGYEWNTGTARMSATCQTDGTWRLSDPSRRCIGPPSTQPPGQPLADIGGYDQASSCNAYNWRQSLNGGCGSQLNGRAGDCQWACVNFNIGADVGAWNKEGRAQANRNNPNACERQAGCLEDEQYLEARAALSGRLFNLPISLYDMSIRSATKSGRPSGACTCGDANYTSRLLPRAESVGELSVAGFVVDTTRAGAAQLARMGPRTLPIGLRGVTIPVGPIPVAIEPGVNISTSVRNRVTPEYALPSYTGARFEANTNWNITGTVSAGIGVGGVFGVFLFMDLTFDDRDMNHNLDTRVVFDQCGSRPDIVLNGSGRLESEPFRGYFGGEACVVACFREVWADFGSEDEPSSCELYTHNNRVFRP